MNPSSLCPRIYFVTLVFFRKDSKQNISWVVKMFSRRVTYMLRWKREGHANWAQRLNAGHAQGNQLWLTVHRFPAPCFKGLFRYHAKHAKKLKRAYKLFQGKKQGERKPWGFSSTKLWVFCDFPFYFELCKKKRLFTFKTPWLTGLYDNLVQTAWKHVTVIITLALAHTFDRCAKAQNRQVT